MHNICREIHGVLILLFCSLVEERGIVSWLVFKKISLDGWNPNVNSQLLEAEG